jgi:hypothetical protein
MSEIKKPVAPCADRRRWKRYPVDWPFYITGVSAEGKPFESEGTLCNLSARGSLGRCKDPLPVGMRLEVYITIPFGTGKRLKYSALVVRVESGPNPSVALMFDTARPVFNEEISHAAAMLSTEPKVKFVPKGS